MVVRRGLLPQRGWLVTRAAVGPTVLREEQYRGLDGHSPPAWGPSERAGRSPTLSSLDAQAPGFPPLTPADG